MLLLGSLIHALSGSHGALGASLGTLLQFIRLSSKLLPVILHRMPSSWNPDDPPAELPPYILAFVSCRLGASEACIQQLWTALGAWVWADGADILEDSAAGEEGLVDGWFTKEPDQLLCTSSLIVPSSLVV